MNASRACRSELESAVLGACAAAVSAATGTSVALAITVRREICRASLSSGCMAVSLLHLTNPRQPAYTPLKPLRRGFRVRVLIAIVLTVLFTCATAWSQALSTAQITGVVQDSSGGAVPGAEVKATQTATGL